MIQTKPRKFMVNRRTFLNASTTAAGAIAVHSQLSERAVAQSVDDSPTFRRPKTIIAVPTPSPEFQHVAAGVPDTKMTREATGLLREFSTPVLINHSHRVFFWANEMGRQTGQKFDVELVFICAAFHDFGLLKKFSSATDRFEVDGANAVRQFLEHHGVPNAASRPLGMPYRFTPRPALQHTSLWKWSLYTMASHWIHSALGTKPFPKTFATRWSASFRESISRRKSRRHSLTASDTSPKRPNIRATKTSARISSATTSGKTSTIRSRTRRSQTLNVRDRAVIDRGSRKNSFFGSPKKRRLRCLCSTAVTEQSYAIAKCNSLIRWKIPCSPDYFPC